MAFGSHRAYCLYEGVRVLYNRVAPLSNYEFSYRDVRDIFVNPEHLELIDECSRVFDVGGRVYFEVKHGDMIARFYADPSLPDAFPFPKYLGSKIYQPDHPALAGFYRWVEHRRHIAENFAKAYGVLAALDGACKTPRQVAFIWPVVTHVAQAYASSKDDSDKGATELSELASRLIGATMPPMGVPRMNPSFKEAVIDTAGAITGAQLVSKDHEIPVATGLRASIGSFTGPVDVDWVVGEARVTSVLHLT